MLNKLTAAGIAAAALAPALAADYAPPMTAAPPLPPPVAYAPPPAVVVVRPPVYAWRTYAYAPGWRGGRGYRRHW